MYSIKHVTCNAAWSYNEEVGEKGVSSVVTGCPYVEVAVAPSWTAPRL